MDKNQIDENRDAQTGQTEKQPGGLTDAQFEKKKGQRSTLLWTCY